MNKAKLIETLSEKTGLNRLQIENVIDSMQKIIISTIKSGGIVSLTGFVTFSSHTRHARMGVDPRNPKEKMEIPAVLVPKFKAGKALKDALKDKN
ncbi:MAG: HU family DNA-binding protein [Patescibacteria group bacterium]